MEPDRHASSILNWYSLPFRYVLRCGSKYFARPDMDRTTTATMLKSANFLILCRILPPLYVFSNVGIIITGRAFRFKQILYKYD